ncbi:hypothetical protein HZH68_006541 [Vespula germanica]|uniref:RING-type domain-containing protein n=1 Tax=Vespula germanica TaxID=30212 RepID=A0A834KBQ5_VESGE|nr:hypothetical protein HZH68_006541 [Vespula germanica]
MDYICNRCYCTKTRVDKPFRFTQCKHIFCDNCIKEVTKQCIICGFKRPASLPLVEPLPAEIASYFVPLNETLGSLRTATSLQNTQLSIILERFYDIVIQKTEDMTQECSKYKNNIEKMKEKLNYLKGISPNTISTSTNSVASMDIRRQNNRYSFVSNCMTSEEFRVPTSCKVLKSVRK